MSDKTLVERLREYEPIVVSESCAISTLLGIPCHDHCINCTKASLNALADAIEREYLPRPCFEDGEPVKPGDTIVVDGFEFVVSGFGIGCDGKTLLYGVDEHVSEIETGARVKRPQPEVLDADGVPIKVGDVVYFVGNSGYFDVLGIENVYVHVGRKDNTSTDAFVYPFELTHKQPDSLERIEEDALMDSILYCDKYGLLDNGCNAEEGDDAVRHCTDCGLTCETRMVKHLLRRQRAVLENK